MDNKNNGDKSTLCIKLKWFIIAFLIMVICLMMIGHFFMNSQLFYEQQGIKFSQKLIEFYASLPVGDVAHFYIELNEGDSLIYLTAYTTKGNIAKVVKTPNQKLIDNLYYLSQSDIKCPALIWLCGERIQDYETISISVWTNFETKQWFGEKQVLITIKKIVDSEGIPNLVFENLGTPY